MSTPTPKNTTDNAGSVNAPTQPQTPAGTAPTQIQAPAGTGQTKAAPVEPKKPLITDIEAYSNGLISEKMAKGLKRPQAVEVTSRQIQKDIERGILDPDAVKQWLAAATKRAATVGTTPTGAPAPGTPAGEIEEEFKKLVSHKMSKGLKREQAVEVAIRQLRRDFVKYDTKAFDQWDATIKQRAGHPLLGVR